MATEGPFYPDHLPLDHDNDLIVLGDNLTPAIEQITHLERCGSSAGDGSPVKDATVEIWQCDANAVYHRIPPTAPRRRNRWSKNFQGSRNVHHGLEGGVPRFRDDKAGLVSKPPLAAHPRQGRSKGTRRSSFPRSSSGGTPGTKDGVFQGVSEADQQALVMADFTPIPESKTGEVACTFDLILGRTPMSGKDGAAVPGPPRVSPPGPPPGERGPEGGWARARTASAPSLRAV